MIPRCIKRNRQLINTCANKIKAAELKNWAYDKPVYFRITLMQRPALQQFAADF
jgi:hypothetical protein